MSGVSESWRVILFTDHPLVAAFYAEYFPAQGHQLTAVVTSAKRNPDYLAVIGAVPVGTDVVLSEHPKRWAAMVAPLRPDLIITNVFPRRLPADLLAVPRLGAVNIHGGLLPEQRGTDGAQWFIREGVRTSGWTMHRMTPDLDTGPILARVRFPIEEDDEVEDVMRRYGEHLAPVVTEGLARVAAGDAGEPQDETRARYYPRIPDEAAWKAIDWTQPARTVHNVVRSSTFARDLPPGAVGEIDGVPHRITKTRLVSGVVGGREPGELIGREGEMLLVQCGDGPLGVVGYEAI